MQKTTKNKELVTDFYTLAVIDWQIEDAFEHYVSEGYIQHSPHLPDGKEPVIAFLLELFGNPQMEVSIKRVIAEDDLVVIHQHSRNSHEDPGIALVEIYRVKDNKIVEHWDVLQPVPQESANSNSMF